MADPPNIGQGLPGGSGTRARTSSRILGHPHVVTVTVCGFLRLVIKEQHVALQGAWRWWQLLGSTSLELRGRSRGTGREGAKFSAKDHEPGQAEDQEETKRSREAMGWAGRTQAVEPWVCSGLSHSSARDFGQLLHFSPSVAPHPQNDLPSRTEVMRNSRTHVQAWHTVGAP